MIFETAQLRTLVAIVETGSFTKAAAMVNLSQPAVSLHIKRLEDQLMRKIFERDGRRVALTADGATLVGFARRILALHSEAETAFEGMEIAGRVRLGAPEYFDSKVLALLLAHFAQRHPGVELDVKIALGPEVRSAFENGELDVAILNTELGEGDEPLLGHDDRVWVASTEFKLAPDKPLPLVLFNTTCDWRRLAIQLLDQHEISWKAVLSSGGVTGLVAGIEAGLGVSIFPKKGLPSSMRDVGESYRLPILPPFEYRLFESKVATAAAHRVAFAIRDVFGHEEILTVMA